MVKVNNFRLTGIILASSIISGIFFLVLRGALQFFYLSNIPSDLTFFSASGISFHSMMTGIFFLCACIAGGVIVSLYIIKEEGEQDQVENLQAAEQLNALMNSSFDVHILMDNEGTILKTNKNGAAYFRQTEEELAGKNISSIFSEERFEKRKSQFDEVISTGKPLETDEFFDGAYYRLILYPYFKDGKNVSMVTGTLRDISNEKRAETETRESREHLALAMSSAGISIWEIWEKKNKMIIIDSDEILEGYEKKRNVNRYNEFWSSVHPDDWKVIGDALKDHYTGKTGIYTALYRMKMPDGIKWLNSVGKVVERDEAGDPVKMIGIRIDVTNLHNYREAVIKANKKLNLLSGITRHDILNQVTAIRLSEEILLSEDHIKRNTEAWDLFEIIFRSTEMIEKQILFTKDYQNLGVSSPTWQKMSVIMDEIEKEAALMDLRVEDHTRDLEIFADPMFEKVLFNLIDNSVRHGSAKTFTADYRIDEEGCVLVFADDGTGIEDDVRGMIFGKGFGRNTGLGLFLVREVLDITGINIVETGEFNHGARFELSVPEGAFRIDRE